MFYRSINFKKIKEKRKGIKSNEMKPSEPTWFYNMAKISCFTLLYTDSIVVIIIEQVCQGHECNLHIIGEYSY